MMDGTWEPVTDGVDYASRAVHAGTDIDGSPIFIARAPHINEILPGKLVVRPDSIQFYYCYGGREILVTESVQFLVNDGCYWENAQRSDGEVPANAVIGGATANNDVAYFIGRANHNDGVSTVWTPGKIDALNRCLFIPYGGLEHRKKEYYVLVKRRIAVPAAPNRNEVDGDNENSSGGCLDCLRAVGRLFTECKINITNCTFFKIN